MKRLLPVLAASLSLLWLTGCMTAAELRQKRIEENPELFAQLDPASQARIAAGSIAIGDSQTAVWFALGEPDRRTYQTSVAGTTELWNYMRTESQPYQTRVYDPLPPPPPPRPHGYPPPPPPRPSWHYETHYMYYDVLDRQIQFQNGVVVLIQQF